MLKKITPLLFLIALLSQGPLVFARELKTVTLDVDKMTCKLCPITVKKALKKVDGVTEVIAKYEGDGIGWAQVTFDTDKTDVSALTLAAEKAGYPSRLQQQRLTQP